MARSTTATETIRVPKQFVRAGRGTPGYKGGEGVKIEEYESEEYERAAGKAASKHSDPSGPSKAELLARAAELGITDVSKRTSNADLTAKIAAAEAS